MRGKFITMEGGEGGGKSTMMERVARVADELITRGEHRWWR
jgi:thymidylate kinase